MVKTNFQSDFLQSIDKVCGIENNAMCYVYSYQPNIGPVHKFYTLREITRRKLRHQHSLIRGERRKNSITLTFIKQME